MGQFSVLGHSLYICCSLFLFIGYVSRFICTFFPKITISFAIFILNFWQYFILNVSCSSPAPIIFSTLSSSNILLFSDFFSLLLSLMIFPSYYFKWFCEEKLVTFRCLVVVSYKYFVSSVKFWCFPVFWSIHHFFVAFLSY